MFKLFNKKETTKDNNQQNLVDVAKELISHGARGGIEGIGVASNNLIFREIYDWAIRHRARGENITKEVLIAKMEKVFYSDHAWKLYSKTLGYNKNKIDQLAEDVMSALN